MILVAASAFTEVQLGARLSHATPAELDELDFGVIGFDAAGLVRVYNSYEATAAGLAPSRVVDRPLFTEVAPCMNNFMVAHRFTEAIARGIRLDETIDYVLTLRMRPTRVRLRLIVEPGAPLAYVLVERRLGADRADTRGARMPAP